MNLRKQIWYELAGFILDNRVLVVDWINSNYNTNISRNISLDELNDIVAGMMMSSETFTYRLLEFIKEKNSGEYRNFVVAVATAVSKIGETIANIVINVKNAAFQRQQAARFEQAQMESDEFYQNLAELRARKEVSIELGKAQSEILLERDLKEDKTNRNTLLITFGVFVVGAIALSFILKKKKNG